MLQYIQEEAERINILANKLLSSDYRKSPEIEILNLNSIFQKLKTFLEYKLKDNNIQFSILSDEPCFLYSDANLLFQIFLNLALNSIEAIDEGGDIEVMFRENRNGITVEMKDDGPGIPERLKKRIYEPFFTTKRTGSGLGLTVTKSLIESLYGYIKLLPAKRGTDFEVFLPSHSLKE